MPALFNPRHERFARTWIKTGNASEAYRQAGYNTTTALATRVNACRLLSHANVQARIGELRRQMTYKTRVTLETLLEQAEDARRLAMASEQPSAAIQATTLQAKLVGLLVERKESGQPGDFAQLETTEAIVAKVRADLGDDAANGLAAMLSKTDQAPVVPHPLLVTGLSSDINGLPN